MNIIFINNVITYFIISKNIAQKHIRTATTDNTLDSSVTETIMAVIATNISVLEVTPYKYQKNKNGEQFFKIKLRHFYFE